MEGKFVDGSSDALNPEGNEFSTFSDKNIRLGFIRKVYGIFTIQLAVTLTIMSIIIFVEPIKLYCQQNIWLTIVAFIATFVSIIVLACCSSVRRSYPSNIIFLGVFTVCEGLVLGIISSFYKTQDVFIAIGVTCLVVFGLTVFAFQTKIDFTILNGALFIAFIVLLIMGLLCSIIQNNYLSLVYSCLGALIFSLYILVDTQLIVGGRHKYSVSPEEYIFVALNLYLDVVNLFLFILDIINRSK